MELESAGVTQLSYEINQMTAELTVITNSYNQDGCYFPVNAMSPEQALDTSGVLQG